MSTLWRGETLAGQLQLLDVCSYEQLHVPPQSDLKFYIIPTQILGLYVPAFSILQCELIPIYSAQYCDLTSPKMTSLS